MDWYVAWVKTQQELSDASKADHYWKTLPSDLRSRMPASLYREKRAAALTRLRRADPPSPPRNGATRGGWGRGGRDAASYVPSLGPASDPGNALYA